MSKAKMVSMMLHAKTHEVLGELGEKYIMMLLREASIVCSTPALSLCGDIEAIHPHTGEIAAIEVKTARADFRGQYKFSLCKKGHTNVYDSEYLILLFVTVSGVVVWGLPVSKLNGLKNICIASHPDKYNGKYKVYGKFEPFDVFCIR